MRIAYFVNQYPKVSHSFIRREIQALEALGNEVSRYSLRGWADDLVDADDLSERGKTSYLLRAGLLGLLLSTLVVLVSAPAAFVRALGLALRTARGSDRPWPFHLIYLAEACRLLRCLRSAPVEHMHAHFGTNSAEVVMLAHALGGPGYSFTVHGPEEFDKPQALHLKEKIEHARFVVAISSYGRSQLFRWVDYSQWGKVKVVHCGLEKAFHSVAPVPVPAAGRLVCIGRLCEQKGQLLLVEAARHLAEKNLDFELVLAGDGEMRPEVERLIALYQLQGKVRITGWISAEQVRDELLAARGMVLASFAEGLPVVIMEAMALRRPVLTTYVAGIPELVQEGVTGWLFPAGSVEALVDAMTKCLESDAASLQAMGDAAYQRVLVRHDIETEAAKLAGYFAGAGL